MYTIAGNGTALMLGLFNSTWGQFPAAVSWQATGQQVRADGGAAGAVITAAGTN